MGAAEAAAAAALAGTLVLAKIVFYVSMASAGYTAVVAVWLMVFKEVEVMDGRLLRHCLISAAIFLMSWVTANNVHEVGTPRMVLGATFSLRTRCTCIKRLIAAQNPATAEVVLGLLATVAGISAVVTYTKHIRGPEPARVNMVGKTVIITGCNQGIGYESAKWLYEQGAHVVMGKFGRGMCGAWRTAFN